VSGASLPPASMFDLSTHPGVPLSSAAPAELTSSSNPHALSSLLTSSAQQQHLLPIHSLPFPAGTYPSLPNTTGSAYAFPSTGALPYLLPGNCTTNTQKNIITCTRTHSHALTNTHTHTHARARMQKCTHTHACAHTHLCK